MTENEPATKRPPRCYSRYYDRQHGNANCTLPADHWRDGRMHEGYQSGIGTDRTLVRWPLTRLAP